MSFDDVSFQPQGVHIHRPVNTPGGQRICQDCHAVIIDPILDHDDERLKHPAWWTFGRGETAALMSLGEEEYEETVVYLRDLFPCCIDWWLIEATNALGIEEPPDYILAIGEKYEDEEPPHIKNMWGPKELGEDMNRSEHGY
jgi:hypothetical protein